MLFVSIKLQNRNNLIIMVKKLYVEDIKNCESIAYVSVTQIMVFNILGKDTYFLLLQHDSIGVFGFQFQKGFYL